MATVNISAMIDESDKLELSKIAKKTGRSQNQHIARAIHDHIMRENSFMEMVQEGQSATEFVEHNEVDSWLASWGTENELDAPKTKSV